MLPRFTAATALVVAVSSLLGVRALPKVTRSGRYLYTDDGNRFYIKGAAYQEQGVVIPDPNNPFPEPSSFTDPLADSSACARDIPSLKDLGVNAIRVYSVDSSLDHDACMKAFSDAGIYTIIDLSLPLNGSIDRIAPSWSTNLLDQYLNTIDLFSKYDNVLAYNVANEAVNSTITQVAPYVKAAARDVKAYLKSKSSSALVGYAAIDGSDDFRTTLATYLSCDPSGQNSDSTSIDIYGLNNYEWCGDGSLQETYGGINSAFKDYNVVAYFSEFGCVSQPPRLWTEVAALFSTQMTDIWSGGIAFSYFSVAIGPYGLVNISSDGKTVTTSDDYNRLKDQYTKASPPNSPSKSSATASYPACPATNSAFVASTTLPPTPDKNACGCLSNLLSCQFKPNTANYSAILGTLVDTGCGLLGQEGLNCDDISGNGQNGTYGRLSGCDPTIKLSYVMSEHYEANSRNAQACSFGGNGTVNPLAPSSASAANSAASSCISNPSATFVPAGPSGSGGGSTSNGNSGTSGGRQNGAVSLVGDRNTLVGMAVVVVMSVTSAVWTLL